MGDTNGNGIGDVADIQATASDLPCHVYLPVVAAQWHQPWPTETPSPEDVAPLHVFYAIHTHVQGDWFPYSSPGMTTLDEDVADNMIDAIEGIAGVLDDHGAKGTWEVVYGASKGLCTYQGDDHVFRQLIDSGHEVGVHAHHTEEIERAFQNLQDECGITADVTSGFMIDASDAGPEGAQEVASQAIEEGVALGMTVSTENLSPGGRRNPFGPLCDNQIGAGNDMWRETGNLMFPWRPDYVNGDIGQPPGGHDVRRPRRPRLDDVARWGEGRRAHRRQLRSAPPTVRRGPGLHGGEPTGANRRLGFCHPHQ
ncbi:MAG: hypothetical protein MAG451_00281 [Anaerolineales bacterium]|nr:hypothetical protein [Anaerolineales bacterium]